MLSERQKEILRIIEGVPQTTDLWLKNQNKIIQRVKKDCDRVRPGDSIYFVKECRRCGVRVSDEITFLTCYYFEKDTKVLYPDNVIEVRT